MNGAQWLQKRVRVFAGYDWRKEHHPMIEGEVIGYIDGPSIIVRTADGSQSAWPVSLPMEELPAPANAELWT